MSGTRHRLRKTWQRVRNEPRLGRNVLTLAVLVALGLGAGGYILSQQGSGTTTWPWQDQFVFTAEFDNAPAVSPGNGQEVRIAGVQVGQIESASVSDDGKAELTLSIEPGHTVYDNARTVLRPKSPMNEMYVEIDPGGPPGKPLAEGDMIPATQSQRPIQADEVLAHLDTNTRSALTALLTETDTALAHAPEALPGGLSATDRVVRDLKPVVVELQTRKDKLAQLVTALAQVSSAVGENDQRLAELARNLQHTLAAAGEQSDAIDEALAQLPDVTDELGRATGSVQALSDQLDPVLDSLRQASGTLPDSLRRLTATVDRVGETVDVANPVVTKARPVVNDLRPLVTDVNALLPDLRHTTSRLEPITASLLPYLNDLGAFVYQTNSVTSLHDANGGILRGLLQVTPSTLPLPGAEILSSPTPR
ncbi:ABC-type transport system involved in resistance to organic solvents, periplasmic component [Saccharomonospora marina XMU15]|uniref:ABC-type transport system involved in resistance to organic solvents, periplasmic component n=1 Tax=Saccharomonospora marina XMU15 TaxID=882083 RepID=H5X812_9PSEU|nr:MlaD family protein [Saccharomonospora marina]EHR53544.1 ABC-type transport system involved in resistance to organic solvents, periplasmic component [Saccharomonospora marina XMU15]